MSHRFCAFFAALMALVLPGPTASAADERLDQLIERLVAAEARICELEQESDTDSAAASENPFATASWTDDETLKKADGEASSIAKLAKDWEEQWDEQDESNKKLAKDIKESVQPGSSATRSMKLSGRIHADYWGIPGSSPGINQIETGNPAITP